MEFGDFLSNDEGSDNELTWDDEDENDDEISNENGNSVGKKRKFIQNDGDRKPKKLRRERKVPAPTAEEMIHLRETETLFKSNLFRLEIEEMIKEVKPLKTFQKAARFWIDSFKKFLKTLDEDDEWIHVSETDWLNKYDVSLPLPDIGKIYDGAYRFIRPIDVKTIGSFNADFTMGPKFSVDVAVVVPKAFYRKKDYLNQTYHYKRALYLSSIAGHLKNSELISKESQMKFTCSNGDSLKPVLVVNPRGKGENKIEVIIHAIPEEDTFPCKRFIPSMNNVRKAWWGCDDSDDELASTPFYNTSIVEDLVTGSNEKLRQEAYEGNDNMKEAVCLLRVWLRQRHLDQGYGAFTVYIMSMLLIYLKDKQKINKHMSSYQIIRNVWLYLSQSNWCKEGVSLCKIQMETIPDISVFHSHFDVVFVDPSGYLNMTARMNKFTYLKVQSESALAIELLDTTVINGFHALFMVKMPFIQQYDHLICFTNEDSICSTVSNNTPSGNEMDHHGDPVPVFQSLITDLLFRGLGQRASEIGVKLIEPVRWDVNSLRPSYTSDVICFGIRLHPENALNIIDKGPQANLPEAADFREFWSGKSELRRFKDGMVSECIVWGDMSCSLSKRFVLTKDIVSFLLHDKLKFKSQEYIYVADQLDHIITPKMHNISAEEACLKVHKSLEELSRQLMELDDLPLEVTTVHCISPVYRYADVFPPLAPARPRGKQRPFDTFTSRGHTLVDQPSIAPFFVPAIDLVLQMTFTRRWPDDLAACRRLTAAFYLAIASKLHLKHKVKFLMQSDCLIVQKDDLMFRLYLGYSKEISLMKLSITQDGVKLYRDTPESIEMEKKFINLPNLSGALHGLSVLEIGFGGGVRLVKRWLASHMLDSYHFPPVAAELIVASLLMKPQPFKSLVQPQQIFLRFLNLISSTNWNNEFLIVNFNDLLSKEEIREIERNFEKERSNLPPLVIVTPYDKSGALWTRKLPTLSTLVRLARLASTALNILQISYLTSIPQDKFISLFTPNLSLYDVVIELELSMVPRKHEQVSFKPPADKDSYDKSTITLPVTDFDPPQLYLQYLRDNYEELALFFHDPYGGSKIGVLFKPTSYESSEFKVNSIGGKYPNYDTDPVSFKTNFKSIISDFKEAGRGIVKSISFSKKFKQFL